MSNIPKIFHFIWIGDESLRPDNYINTWKKMNPDWEVRIWGNKEYNEYNWYNKEQLEHMWSRGLYHGVADIMRYEILYNYGGFYVDADSECIKPLEDWLFEADVMAIYENEIIQPGLVAVGYIASIPGHPLLKIMMEYIHTTEDIKVLEPWRGTGPTPFTRIINQHPEYNIKLWPSHMFLPVHCTGQTYTGDGVIFAKQKWGSTHYSYSELYKEKLGVKIAIYTICKNEIQNVDRWVESNSEADYRLVCDTGSTDGTADLLREKGVIVVPISVNPWRFDVARNTGLNLLPADIDVCIWQDLDEALLPGWREELEKHWVEGATIANHRYRNNSNPWQWHSKIHARHNCRWVGPVHETLEWCVPQKDLWIPEIYLDEKQDITKDRKGYLDLLLKKIAEGDKCWRTFAFLANDYENISNLDECIKRRIESYDLCDDGPIVKSYIAKAIANNYVRNNNPTEAEKWFQISVNQSNERESWFSYAEYFYNKQDWEQCFVAIKKCLSVQEKRDGFTQDWRAWSFVPYDYAALACFNLGLIKQAIAYGEKALEMLPDDPRLIQNLAFYKEKL